jgi:hypothetical protein
MGDNDYVAWALRQITPFRECDPPCCRRGMPQTSIKDSWPRWLAGRGGLGREIRRAPRRRV